MNTTKYNTKSPLLSIMPINIKSINDIAEDEDFTDLYNYMAIKYITAYIRLGDAQFVNKPTQKEEAIYLRELYNANNWQLFRIKKSSAMYHYLLAFYGLKEFGERMAYKLMSCRVKGFFDNKEYIYFIADKGLGKSSLNKDLLNGWSIKDFTYFFTQYFVKGLEPANTDKKAFEAYKSRRQMLNSFYNHMHAKNHNVKVSENLA